ncbi:MAG: protein kinase [Alphaproteobacteria bacterium]|nr:protein kinase [Alphaproteobacteria bacterium]MCB9795684.1 protein kinase [Alphaproteobacteria bacterium]
MSRVYEARRESLAGVEPKVALKVILPEHANDEKFQNLFVNEARVGSQLQHQNLVQIQDFDRQEDCFYLVMEYVEGLTLRRTISHCKRNGVHIPLAVIAELGRQICEGLHYAHTARREDGVPLNLVHRDIKPSNLILNPQGVVKILDFGISKALTASESRGTVKGTWGYMSPEQAQGGDVGPAADQYGVAAVLYELAMLRPLFPEKKPRELRALMVQDEAVRRASRITGPHGPLVPILIRALQRDPFGRWPDAMLMAQALARLVPDQVVARQQLLNFQSTILTLDRLRKSGRGHGGEAAAARAAAAELAGEPPSDFISQISQVSDTSRPSDVSAGLSSGHRSIPSAPTLPPPPNLAGPSVPGPGVEIPPRTGVPVSVGNQYRPYPAPPPPPATEVPPLPPATGTSTTSPATLAFAMAAACVFAFVGFKWWSQRLADQDPGPTVGVVEAVQPDGGNTTLATGTGGEDGTVPKTTTGGEKTGGEKTGGDAVVDGGEQSGGETTAGGEQGSSGGEASTPKGPKESTGGETSSGGEKTGGETASGGEQTSGGESGGTQSGGDLNPRVSPRDPKPPDERASGGETKPPDRGSKGSAEPAGLGTLTISSIPKSTVYVDSVQIRTTPVFQHELTAGSHSVMLVSEDGKRTHFTVVVEAGSDTKRIYDFATDSFR